jgi:hypothetical protein
MPSISMVDPDRRSPGKRDRVLIRAEISTAVACDGELGRDFGQVVREKIWRRWQSSLRALGLATLMELAWNAACGSQQWTDRRSHKRAVHRVFHCAEIAQRKGG